MHFISDLHIGALRSGGTTAATGWQLRQELLAGFDNLLGMVPDGDILVIGGDLFDTFNIPLADLKDAFMLLHKHATRLRAIYLMAGNHDLSKSSNVKSAFQLLCDLLSSVHGNVYPVFEPMTVDRGPSYVKLHLIPHLANQALFDKALEEVHPFADYCVVHANYDNGFAEQSDHSLNVSKAQAQACPAKWIVFAHEHQGRQDLNGKVQVIGNQMPSSVSDCKGNDFKFLAVLTGSGVIRKQVWSAKEDFAELDWQSLDDTGARFIRVIGEATATQAPEVSNAIARFRAKSKALVVTNAVKIASADSAAVISTSLEEIRSFRIRDAIKEILSPEQWDRIQPVMEKHNVFAVNVD